MRLHPRDWPIYARMTGGIVLLVAVTVLVIEATAMWRGARAYRTLALRPLEEVAETTAESLDELVRKARTELRILAKDGAVVRLCSGGPRDGAQAQIDAYRDHDPDLALVLVADAAGDVLAAAPDVVPPGTNVRERPYFAPALGGETWVSGMRAGVLGEGVYLSAPVEHAGNTVGIVMLRLEAARFQRIVDGKDIGARGSVLIGERLGDAVVWIAAREPDLAYTTAAPLSAEDERAARERWGRAVAVRPAQAELLTPSSFEARQDGIDWIGGAARCLELPWVVVTRLPAREFRADYLRLVLDDLSTIGLALLAAAAVAALLARSILKPVRALTGTAERIAAGDLDARTAIQSDDELGRLAGAFDRMVPKLAERLQLKESLAIAAEVQRELLPKGAPDFPGLDVHGRYQPYEQIGGDYFDFLDLRPQGDGRLAVVLGDVVGHGIAASLLMATARAHVRSCARPLGDLGALFRELNTRLEADLTEEQFMTMALYAFDPRLHRVDWCGAGQDAAFHYRVATGGIEEVPSKNVPLGVLSDWDYQAVSRADLEPGDVFLLGTDGIWETRNADGEQFGKERVHALLERHCAESAKEIVDAVLRAVAIFRGRLPRQDDVTLVAVKLTKP